MRAGLVGDQSRAEHPRGFLLHVVDGFHHLDAAGLAASAGVDLRFHHPDRTAQFLRALDRFVDVERRYAARHRHAEFAQHRFCLIFVNVHDVLSAEWGGLF